jgi:formylglycine-generating enzyme required for sulfatase activity
MGFSNPKAGDWNDREIQGRLVHVGSEMMIAQTDNQRGRPYVYNSGPTRFVIITEDEAWAADILRQLPKEPVESQAYPRAGNIEGKDGAPMVKVPAGEFLMGSDSTDSETSPDEHPQHKVTLGEFYIDKYEVTNGQYRAFLASVASAGHAACDPAEPEGKDHRPHPQSWLDYRMNTTNQPVVGVDWYDASSYCRWAGKRLPTEAEWEKAARGTDGRIYPWGNEWESSRARASETKSKRSSKVGSFPSGAGPYGAEDMAGNVWEWVHDWYGEQIYEEGPRENPSGPATGEMHVVRGGTFSNKPEGLRAAVRNHGYPTGRINGVGFRCAKD